MPLSLEDKEYKLVFLDTNALSEIVKNISGAREGFFKTFPAGEWIPCFTIYNVFELKNTINANTVEKTTFDHFYDFFKIYPFLLVWPFRLLVEYEVKGMLKNDCSEMFFGAFTNIGSGVQGSLAEFLDMIENNKELKAIIDHERAGEPMVADIWEKQRPSKGKGAFVEYYPKLEEANIMKSLPGILPDMKIDIKAINYEDLPGLRTMLFSQFMRVHHTNKPIGVNDVNDIMISFICPYVDSAVTERYQAEILRRAKSRIPELGSLKIFKLKEIRRN